MSPAPHAAVFALAFRLATPFGPCVGVALDGAPTDPDVLLPLLHVDERPLAADLRGRRLVEFAGGRIAARLGREGMPGAPGPTLRTAAGAPVCDRAAVSIAHTRHLAVALTGPSAARPVGVDVELLATHPGDGLLEERITTDDERAADQGAGRLAVVERLALKEAAWKALHPLVGPIPLRDIHVARRSGGISVAVPRLNGSVALAGTLHAIDGHALGLMAATRG